MTRIMAGADDPVAGATVACHERNRERDWWCAMAGKRKRINPEAPAPVGDANAANAFGGYVFAAVLLVIAAGITWYFAIPLDVDIASPDFNPLVVVPGSFAAIGLYVAARASRDALRARKFGKTTLVASPVRPGGTLTGIIRTSRDLAPTGDFTVTLRCIRTTFVQDASDSRPTGRHADREIWAGSRSIPSESVRASAGVPFSFDIPQDALPSRGPPVQTTTDGDVRWILEATAPMPGLDFYAVFAVTVLRPARG
jgi:hypothetical protein